MKNAAGTLFGCEHDSFRRICAIAHKDSDLWIVLCGLPSPCEQRASDHPKCCQDSCVVPHNPRPPWAFGRTLGSGGTYHKGGRVTPRLNLGNEIRVCYVK